MSSSVDSYFSGLNLILTANDAPVLDPIIIDNPVDIGTAIRDALICIRNRLVNAGFIKYEQAVVSTHTIISLLENYLLPDVKLVSDNWCDGTIFILTKEADEVAFIHPPYKDDGSIMSWDEYYLRLLQGEKLKLIIAAPWAQAKIIIR